MLLPGALLEEIARTLGGGAAAPNPAPAPEASPPGQRRREPRRVVRAGLTVIPLNDRLETPSFEVTVRDLSAGGIGFLHDRRMALDEQFVVLLPDGRESVAVLCAVAYYQPMAERLYSIGARFVRVLRRPAAPLPTRSAA